jgi:hypothetical protein
MKHKKATSNPDKRAAGHYSIARFEDGLTPKQRLDTANAIAREFQNRREEEAWQTKAQAEAIAQETAEIIQADLYGTLPLSLAGKLSGRVFSPGEVRTVIRAEVDAMVKEWVKGERVSAKAIKP